MEEDRLSDLPKIILHDILSRLPDEDAARTSVLSKAWAQTWSTFPILSFCDSRITIARRRPGCPVDSTKIKQFLDNVGRTLLRFRNQGLAIEQFKLYMSSFDLYHVSKEVDLWFKLAIKSGARVLKLHRWCQCKQFYILPTSILEAKSLTKLVLRGRIKVDQSLVNHSLKFSSLQVLKLYVYGIPEVYVDSPCLENLHYGTSWRPLEKIDFNKCKNMRELLFQSLKSTIITNKWLLELFANFPFLESLKLEDCAISERIDISSVQLKMLKLEHCSSMNEVNIDAPNLLSCVYADRRPAPKSISFSKYSSQLKVNVRIEIYNIDFQNFRKFIQNFKPKFLLASASLNIDIHQPMHAFNLVVLQVSSPPPSIKDLVLFVIPRNEEMFLPIVYGILSFCCPATISVNSGCCRAFVEFFYEALKGKHVDNCFCNVGNTKCWWHDLKDVKVTSTMNMVENVDFKTMLDMLFSATVSFGSICFGLEF